MVKPVLIVTKEQAVIEAFREATFKRFDHRMECKNFHPDVKWEVQTADMRSEIA